MGNVSDGSLMERIAAAEEKWRKDKAEKEAKMAGILAAAGEVLVEPVTEIKEKE